MNYTKEQFDALAPYEEHFGTAVRSRWSRYPGAEGVRLIHRVFTSATGDRRRLNSACSRCVLSLLQDAGRLYFADKAEMEENKPKRKKPCKKKD